MNVYKGRLLKKSSNRKSKLVLSTLVTTWLSNIAFHLRLIWLQTLVAIDSESRLTSFPSFCAPPSEVAVLFILNLSRRPFLWQIVDSDLLLCTGLRLEHAVLFLCHIFTQRLMTDKKIERSNGCCFGRQQLLANSIENFTFHVKRKCSLRPEMYKALKPFLTDELSQYSKSGSMFSSLEPVAAHNDCSRLRNALCLYLPVQPAQECLRSAPSWFCPLNLRLPSGTAFESDCQMTGRGSNLDSNVKSASWPTSCKGFIASEITA